MEIALGPKRKSRKRADAAGARARNLSSARNLSAQIGAAETASAKGRMPLIVVTILLTTAALTTLVYVRVAWYPFVNYDDGLYVFQNSHVLSGLSWSTVRWALTSFDAANWHPLTWLSHALDCQIYGAQAGGHHVTSVLLHIANAVLLCLLLLRATGAPWRSFLVAALFALHPLNVESVAWVAERKNLLCTFFFLIALGAYGWYASKPGVLRYLSVAALFVLGLASKPMAITFPFVLLLVDFWPLGRIEGWGSPQENFPVPQALFSRLVLEKVPLLALSVASGVITFVAQSNGGAVPLAAGGWTVGWRIENAVHSYAMYLCKFFVPVGLAPFYPGAMLHWWEVAWAVLLLAVGGVVWKFRSSEPYLITGFLWFLGTMIPVIGIVQVGNQAMADRYAYIPMIGICVAVVWGFSEAAEGLSVGIGWRWAAAGLVLGAMAVLSWRQVGYWKSSVDLWSHALAVTRSNSLAEVNLGMGLTDAGREDEAYLHFQKALALEPDDHIALWGSGIYLVKHGRYQESIEKLERFLRVSKNAEEITAAYRALGVAYDKLGDRVQARANFVRATQMTPNDWIDMRRLGRLDMEDAIDKAKNSVAAHPTPEGYVQLGQLLQENGKVPDAQMAYERALQLNPRFAQAQQALEALKGRQQE